MNSNFIPHPMMPELGRCRVCDMPFSKQIPKEVAGHLRFHKRYLEACDGAAAPVNEAERQRMRAEGLAPQFDEWVPFKDRLAAAERWLVAEHHEHLFHALLYEVKRLDLREYFTANVERRGRLGLFQADVATELRLRYSDNFIG